MRQTLSDLENQWQLKLETQQRDYDKEIGEMKLKAKAYDAKIRSLEKEIKDQEEIVDRTVAERDQLLTKVESLRQHHSVESETFSQVRSC